MHDNYKAPIQALDHDGRVLTFETEEEFAEWEELSIDMEGHCPARLPVDEISTENTSLEIAPPDEQMSPIIPIHVEESIVLDGVKSEELDAQTVQALPTPSKVAANSYMRGLGITDNNMFLQIPQEIKKHPRFYNLSATERYILFEMLHEYQIKWRKTRGQFMGFRFPYRSSLGISENVFYKSAKKICAQGFFSATKIREGKKKYNLYAPSTRWMDSQN